MNSKDKSISIPIDKITFVIFFILLFDMFFSNSVNVWIWHANSPNYSEIPLWYKSTFLVSEYILVVFVIWINGNNLSVLNIDKPFIVILLFAGILISLYYVPIFLGWVTLLSSLVIFRRLSKNDFTFTYSVQNHLQISWIFVSGLVPVVLFCLTKLYVDGQWIKPETFIVALYYANLPRVLIQEIVFRGLAGMFLRFSGLNEMKIFYVQVLLFWFAHINYWGKPIIFWLWLPLASLWLGLLVRYSKSIALSTLGHFLFNLFAVLSG